MRLLEIMRPIEAPAVEKEIAVMVELFGLFGSHDSPVGAFADQWLQFFECVPDGGYDFHESAHRLKCRQ